jgi:hypothetical protein
MTGFKNGVLRVWGLVEIEVSQSCMITYCETLVLGFLTSDITDWFIRLELLSHGRTCCITPRLLLEVPARWSILVWYWLGGVVAMGTSCTRTVGYCISSCWYHEYKYKHLGMNNIRNTGTMSSGTENLMRTCFYVALIPFVVWLENGKWHSRPRKSYHSA